MKLRGWSIAKVIALVVLAVMQPVFMLYLFYLMGTSNDVLTKMFIAVIGLTFTIVFMIINVLYPRKVIMELAREYKKA